METISPAGRVVQPIALLLPIEIRTEIVRHLRDAAPLEGVGLLAAKPESPDGIVRGNRYYCGTNQDASATRYTMAPDEVLAAFRDIEEHGWRLGGIVHSHPAGAPDPSPTDRREYRYPEALMIIVSLAGDVPELRAWWLGDGAHGRPAEVPVVDSEQRAPATRREEEQSWVSRSLQDGPATAARPGGT